MDGIFFPLNFLAVAGPTTILADLFPIIENEMNWFSSLTNFDIFQKRMLSRFSC